MMDVVGTLRAVHGVIRAVKVSLIAAVTVVVLGASCTGGPEAASPSQTTSVSPNSETPSTQPAIDYAALADGLEAAGVTVRPGGPTREFPTSLLAVPGRRLWIEGKQALVFEYPTEKALQHVRSAIRPRGDQIPTANGGLAIINWAPPHFYSGGKLLVLYFGDKQRTVDALNLMLGPPFASK